MSGTMAALEDDFFKIGSGFEDFGGFKVLVDAVCGFFEYFSKFF